MKLENFTPRLMWEVEYFGVKISIPADHKWVATDEYGEVFSFPVKPEKKYRSWVVPQHYETKVALIGTFEPIEEYEVIKTLRHYPQEAA